MPHLHLSILLFLSLIFSSVLSSEIADAAKPLLIGIISFDTRFLDAQRGLADGLSQQGFRAEQNIRYIIYDVKKDLSRIPSIVQQLQQQHCDLIMTITTPVVLAVKKSQTESRPIPVVFTMVSDPVGSKVVPSLQSPGGYITGIRYNAFAMMPKRLELFGEAFPNMKHIAVFYNHGEAWIAEPVRQVFLPAAKSLGFRVSSYDVHDKKSMIAAIHQFDETVEGVFMVPDPLAISFFGDLVALSRKYKLPIMVLDNILLEKGGVLGYSPSFYSIGQQAATMVAKILAGTNPGRLAIQNPKTIQLVVSLNEAKSLELLLPDSFLVNTDAIIR
jgi:putative ABC transport system substrate-binding protein